MRKITLLFVLLIPACWAQTTWSVCVKKTVASVVTEKCMTLPTATTQAVAKFLIDNPSYAGPSDLMCKHLNQSLFIPILERYPSTALAATKTQLETSVAAYEAQKAAAAPPVPVGEP